MALIRSKNVLSTKSSLILLEIITPFLECPQTKEYICKTLGELRQINVSPKASKISRKNENILSKISEWSNATGYTTLLLEGKMVETGLDTYFTRRNSF